MNWMRWIFPYRCHLEAEIEYCRQQCAQKDRRIVELQDRIDSYVLRPGDRVAKNVTYTGTEPAKPFAVQVRGWDEFRLKEAAHGSVVEGGQ